MHLPVFFSGNGTLFQNEEMILACLKPKSYLLNTFNKLRFPVLIIMIIKN